MNCFYLLYPALIALLLVASLEIRARPTHYQIIDKGEAFTVKIEGHT